MTKLLRIKNLLITCFLAFWMGPLFAQITCESDTTSPVFERCPQDIVLVTMDSCAIVEWLEPLAFDNCSAVTLTGTYQSGTCFSLGTTIVSYIATDSAGNQAICYFGVTVSLPILEPCDNDSIKPNFVNCQTSKTVSTPDSCAFITWAFPFATDNCGFPTVTSSHPPTACLPEGISTIVYTATDAKGNFAKCTQYVRVIRTVVDLVCGSDTIKPIFTNCPTSQTYTTTDSCLNIQWEPPTATDNCSTPVIIGSYLSGDCFQVGTTPIIFYATDAKRNTSICEFSITVSLSRVDSTCLADTTKPEFLLCPTNIVLTAATTDTCAIARWVTPMADDNCSTPNIIGSHQSGTCFPIGVTPIVYYARDAKGNTSRCAFTVTVTSPCGTDTIKPVFTTCPASQTLTLRDTCVRTQWIEPIATDNCSTPSVTSNYSLASCFRLGTTAVIYTATDAKGNKSTCSFNITVASACALDTVKPRFTTCPPNQNLTSTQLCVRVKWTAPVATDNCGTPSVTSNFSTTSFCFIAGTTAVIYTATDAKGNKSTCSFNITVAKPCVIDTTKPILKPCPTSQTLTTIDTCARTQWTPPTATDNCSTPSVTSNFTTNSCFKVGTTVVVYTATDLKGNKSTCSFNITVTSACALDTVKPRFTTCPTSQTLTSSDTCVRAQWTVPVATDNCGTPSVVGNFSPANSCFKEGITSVVYFATDAKGNRASCSFNITVINPCATDTIKPRFTTACPANQTITSLATCVRAQWVAPVATDNCGTPSLTSNVPTTACLTPGTTTIIYTATDTKGNKTSCSFTVVVVNPCATDTIKPVFATCPTSQTLTSVDTCVRAQWTVPTATDNCSTPSVTSNFAPTTACFRTGTTVVIYTAVDAKGNKSTCSFNITVVNPCITDTIKPRFSSCPTNATVTTVDSCARAQWIIPVATDNCSTPSVTSNFATATCFRVGTTAVIYTATDAKGNKTTCSFTITVLNPCFSDTTKPRFSSCPVNIALSSLDTCAIAQWTTPVATDNCTTPRVVGNYASGACFKTGTTAVVYTATDAKNNTSICSFTVTVKNPCAGDTVKPVFYNCPVNIVKETADTAVAMTWRVPTALDNCGLRSTVASHLPGAIFKIGTTVITYTATDGMGNKAYCSFTITIKRIITPCSTDSIAPVFTSCPANVSITTSLSSAIAQWVAPLATDNCGTPTVTSTATSGASFPVGTTAVIYTATDAKGNKKTCSFNVVVTKQTLVIDSTKCYILVARSSKKALSILSASTLVGTDAVQWSYLNGLHQKWSIKTADSNSVNLAVKHTGLNLDTRWGSLANGSRLMQWTQSTTATQKWQLISLNDGYYRIINKGTGFALSVKGGASVTTDGSLLIQQNYTGLTSQQWSIEAVPCTSAAVASTSNDVLEVNAKAEAHRARIEWVDNTGYKNDYYEVEKLNPTSGKFESLKTINNTRFDDQLVSQTVYDETPTEGDNFYRVKVAYLDSLTKVSPVQKVNFTNVNSVKIFPNPTSEAVDIDLSTYSNETVNIDLYNSFGQKVAQRTVQTTKSGIIHFDVSEHQTGTYLIRITAQGKRDVTKQLHIVR